MRALCGIAASQREIESILCQSVCAREKFLLGETRKRSGRLLGEARKRSGSVGVVRQREQSE